MHFRNLPKIARAFEIDERIRLRALREVFKDNGYSLAAAYSDSVADLYAEKDIITRIASLTARIDDLDPEELDDALRLQLQTLAQRISALLEGSDDV